MTQNNIIKENENENKNSELIDIPLLQKLKEQIDSIDHCHHSKILQIIKKHNIHYSPNINGIFVNISNISVEAYDNLQLFIKQIVEQENYINKIESEKQQYIQSLNNE